MSCRRILKLEAWQPFDAPHAAEGVARTYAHQLLVALFHYWNAERS